MMCPRNRVNSRFSFQGMLDVMWHLVTPYELHPEWPSTPPSKSTGFARNGVTRFHFQVLIIQCLESGRRLRSSQRKTSVVGVDLICESQNKNGPSRPVFLAHRQNAGAVFSGGGGEIRTHERLPVAGFQDRCNRPLCHTSGACIRGTPAHMHEAGIVPASCSASDRVDGRAATPAHALVCARPRTVAPRRGQGTMRGFQTVCRCPPCP